MVAQHQAFLKKPVRVDQFQSGFRPGYEAETASGSFVDDLRRQINRRIIQLILLDLSAAFNTICYSTLLEHLSDLFAGGTILQWVRSFLLDNTLRVKLGRLLLLGMAICL